MNFSELFDLIDEVVAPQPNNLRVYRVKTASPSSAMLKKRAIETLLKKRMQEYNQLAKVLFKFNEQLNSKEEEIEKLKEELLSIKLPESYEKKEEEKQHCDCQCKCCVSYEHEPFSREKVKKQFINLTQDMMYQERKEKLLDKMRAEEKNKPTTDEPLPDSTVISKEEIKEYITNFFEIFDRISERRKAQPKIGVEICSTQGFRPNRSNKEKEE